MTSTTRRRHDAGQSLWLDGISRAMLRWALWPATSPISGLPQDVVYAAALEALAEAASLFLPAWETSGGVAAVRAVGADVDAPGESLQRQGAEAFSADWATLVETIALEASSAGRGG